MSKLDRFRFGEKYARLGKREEEKNKIGVIHEPKKVLLTINGHHQEGWQNAMELYRYIVDEITDKVDSIKLANIRDQDSEKKWTLKTVIVFLDNRDYIEALIKKRAQTISNNPRPGILPGGPSPSVKFEDI